MRHLAPVKGPSVSRVWRWLLLSCVSLLVACGGGEDTAEVTDPSDISEPTDLSEPSDAADATDASDPTGAIDVSDATDSGDPSDSTVTVDPSEPVPASGYLSVSGTALINHRGEGVRLTGVNWFGFETEVMLPHGLWSRLHDEMLAQVIALGFNSIRLPFSNEMLASEQEVETVDPRLTGLTPLEAMDVIVATAGELGLRIVLDNHSRASDAYLTETLWYTPTFSEEDWIRDWVSLAERYKNNPTVVAFDLNNEPHGDATWGTGNQASDWKLAAERCAEAIHAVNPDVLIIVEGVEVVNGTYYWWGGNLRGVLDAPVEISAANKLVYSAHDYGPEIYEQAWFSDPNYPDNLSLIWDDYFGFIMNNGLGHLYLGEFGIKEVNGADGRAMQWFESLLAYMGDSYSWAFWSLNPNSGDTGGILMDDWESVEEWKVDALQPFMAPLLD